MGFDCHTFKLICMDIKSKIYLDFNKNETQYTYYE